MFKPFYLRNFMMNFPRLPKFRVVYRSLFVFSLICSLLLSSPGVIATARPQPENIQWPKLEEWQADGILAAMDEPDMIFSTLFSLIFHDARDIKDSEKVAAIAGKLFGSPKDFKKYLKQSLKQPSSYDTMLAPRALEKLGEGGKPFILKIVNLLQDKTQNIRFRVEMAQLLVNMGDTGKPFAADITNLLKDIPSFLKDKTKNAKLRVQTAEFLASRGDDAKPFIPDIVNLFEDKTLEPFDRYNLAFTVCKLGCPANLIIPDFLNILKNEMQDFSFYPESSRLSTIFSNSAAKPFAADVANLLKDNTRNRTVHEIAASALGELGNAAKPFIPDLLTILSDTKQDKELRVIAASSLGKLGEIPAILRFIQDRTQDTIQPQNQYDVDSKSAMRRSVAEALPKLGDRTKPFIVEIANIFRDETQVVDIRIEAGKTLMQMGKAAKPFIPDILNVLTDPKKDPKVRARIVTFLGALDDVASFIPQMRAISQDKMQPLAVRVWAVSSLLRLDDAAKPFIPDFLDVIQGEKLDSIGMGRDLSGIVFTLGDFGDALIPYIPNLRQILNDKTQDSRTRGMAAVALAGLGSTAKGTVPDMVMIIRDQTEPFEVRSRVSRALSSFGEEANPFIPDILNLIKTTASYTDGATESARLRNMFSFGLGAVKLEFKQVLPFIDMAESIEQASDPSWRFNAYVQSGGSDAIKRLLKWVGKPKPGSSPTQLNHEDGVKTLMLFAKTWESSQNLPDLRRSLIQPITNVTQMIQWKPSDKALLTQHYRNLITVNANSSKRLKATIDRLNRE